MRPKRQSWSLYFILLPHLFEVHDDAALLHHGVLLVVVHQVSQGVEALAPAYVVLPVQLRG